MIHVPSRLLPLLSIGIALSSCAPVPEFYEASNLSAKPFNQLDLSKNACGPAALLNSFRFGGSEWNTLARTPEGFSDRERIRAIARGPAMRESRSLPGRARWSRNGINLSDLTDLANEIGHSERLPHLYQQTLFLKTGQSQRAHLEQVHTLLSRSLAKGFPPILSVRRFTLRNGTWTAVQGHFVTVTSVPGRLSSNTESFSLGYIDPWGGRKCDGEISVYRQSFLGKNPDESPNLEAVFPATTVGNRHIRTGEKSLLAISGFLGRH